MGLAQPWEAPVQRAGAAARPQRRLAPAATDQAQALEDQQQRAAAAAAFLRRATIPAIRRLP